MIKKYDYSDSMTKDLISIDEHSFGDIPYPAQELKERLSQFKNYTLFIDYENKLPVGYVGILEVQNLHYHGGWIDLLAVHEEYQNQNIAKKLLDHALFFIRENGMELSSALVRKGNISSFKALSSMGFQAEAQDFSLMFFYHNQDK